MARFYGIVGFGNTVEVLPGVMEDVIVEKPYYGDVLQPARSFEQGEKVVSDVTASNRISVVADDYASENVFAIRFVEWKGVLWSVSNVEEQRPRLIFRLGEVYNGPRAPTPDPSNE